MFKPTAVLTGTRPQGTTTPEIEATSTAGGFRMNGNAATLLGVTKGDCIKLIEGEDADGNKGVYLSKSEEGAKLSFTNNEKATGKLIFSDGRGYEVLGGNDAEVVTFEVATAFEEDEQGNKYFKITETSRVPKQVRVKGEKG